VPSIFIEPLLKTSRKQKKHFFFEKKKQKTSDSEGVTTPVPEPKGPKVFWFFFSKKNRLPAF
jgi:hypothetical protein